MFRRIGDTPFAHPVGQAFRGADALMHKELGHVKADTACTHDGHALTYRYAVAQHVDIADDRWHVLPVYLRVARHNTCRNDHFIKAYKVFGFYLGVQLHADACGLQHGAVPVHQPVEFFLSGHLFGHVELAADFRRAVKESHPVPPLRGCDGRRQAGRSGAHDSDGFCGLRRFDHQFGFVAGAGVHQTTRDLAAESVVQTGLIAGDTRRDLCRAA